MQQVSYLDEDGLWGCWCCYEQLDECLFLNLDQFARLCVLFLKRCSLLFLPCIFTSQQLLFSDGCSAVRYAAANDKSLCIETLMKLKADVNIRSTDGKSPLDRAKEKGHTMCIAALKAAGAT